MSRTPWSCRFAPERRRALRALAAAALLPVAHADAQSIVLAPTPSQPEGPFYPKTLPADRDSDLTQIAGRAATAMGTPLYLTGHVFARDGRPLGNATVELWQCDAYGRYHHAGDEGAPRDDNFQGYGVATTDAQGAYTFKTIRPVPYSGRPPHLHLRVRPASGPTLTTQIYIAGGGRRRAFRHVPRDTRAADDDARADLRTRTRRAGGNLRYRALRRRVTIS